MSLQGQVALVAGATRGAGRAIAVSLGERGATVYCTGRTTRTHRSDMNRAETIEETAEIVVRAGGIGIAVRTDHTNEAEVKALFERVTREQDGRLDILVNDVWGGDPLVDWSKPFWEHSLADGLRLQPQAVHSHMMTSYYAAPLMTARRSGLIIEITDGWDYRYRGNLYYSLAKIGVIHLAQAMAADMAAYGVTCVAATPGFLRSEAMLDHFGVKENNWRDAVAADPHFAQSETPYLLGRGLAAFAADPNRQAKNGSVLTSWDMSDHYGIVDADGRKPHWGRYAKEIGLAD